MSESYTRPSYPEIPPHFQTAYIHRLIQEAHKYGHTPREIAELMRISEEPVKEMLRSHKSRVLISKRLSTKDSEKKWSTLMALVAGITEARRGYREQGETVEDPTRDQIPSIANYSPLDNSVGPRISSPPGTFLRSLADFFAYEKTTRLILNPIIADMQEEYFQALSVGRLWKARWIRLRGCYAFWQSWGISGFLKIASVIWKVVAG